MELEQKLDRRSFLKRASVVGAAALAAPALMTIVGCSKKADDTGAPATEATDAKACDDATKIDEDSKSMRATLRYVEQSDNPDQDCANCQFYHDGADGCGTCDLFTGPVNPKGHCTSWTKKMG